MQTGAYLAMIEPDRKADWAMTSAKWTLAIDLGASLGAEFLGRRSRRRVRWASGLCPC